MKNRKIHLLLIIALFVVAASVLSFTARGSGGQSRTSKRDTPVKPVVLTTATRPKAPSTVSAAATQNQTFRQELSWTFGGKQQRGWYLYDALLSQTLDTTDAPITSDFADAVTKWQKRRGLGGTGVLDQNSWMAMVSHWQGNRLKNRTAATPDQLLTAPPADFYDPSRAPELRQVERETYAAYKKMIAAAIEDLKLAHTASDQLAPSEKYLKIISSFRSREYQDALRRKSPNAGSAGLAVNSPHFTGRALDIYVGGDPVDTKDANRAIQVNTPAYKWLVRNAERFGFRPYFYEPWHWEYVK
ncbi:MAG TPA: D-alanyl-D-alanine carboxypeptidase family protein [Pyrinomonadaceae bacterium]|nr:D-alanyl-D-alanine carboxypeptidase family protein [Pyrinomonadaceae bacterium]